MRLTASLTALLICCGFTAADKAKSPKYQYHTLPPLREQAAIQNGWTAKRIGLIPGLLQKYGVDAWLVSYVTCLVLPSLFCIYILLLRHVLSRSAALPLPVNL